MATKFLEPGGDADFGVGLWDAPPQATPSVVSDFVRKSHLKSIGYAVNSGNSSGKQNIAADAGGRVSAYLYFNALPNATSSIWDILQSGYGAGVFILKMTSAGILQLLDGGGSTQLGSNGPTLATGVWYRVSMTWAITSTTVYDIQVYVNGVQVISVHNGSTLTRTGCSDMILGNISGNLTLDMRSSDHYIDNSAALTDPGDIWVTAKRPFANGTTNGFSTQIGSGGSGYGSGHAPQVNERALSQTNGWSMIGAGAAVTEEYSIEGASAGDFNLEAGNIVDMMGWVSASALLSETAQIIVAGVASNIALTSTPTIFTKVAGVTTYPQGGTDIGIITSTTVTTVSLYECGVIIAYTPPGSNRPGNYGRYVEVGNGMSRNESAT
jgi:hypothetical protein